MSAQFIGDYFNIPIKYYLLSISSETVKRNQNFNRANSEVEIYKCSTGKMKSR